MKTLKSKKNIYLVIILLITVFTLGFTYINKKSVTKRELIKYQHEIKMDEGVDKDLGITEFNTEDYEISSDFVTHLPLVIIDTEGQKIPDAYKYDKVEERFVLKDENMDPYINGKISVIDNSNNVNSLNDEVSATSNMKIKYRGNSSVLYEKRQFKIKLFDEDGNNNKLSFMGMEENHDWILNISMIDSSLLRNYMVYNISANILEYAPEAKYCEVVFKDGDRYVYQGLYLMIESVRKGKGRVDLNDYNPNNNYTSYLLRRDRYDEEDIMIEDTYALNNDFGYGYLGILYPGGNELDENAYNYIHNDIDTIERVIYSEDKNTFLKYGNYIDVDSFIDYFLINEFFANYDAGNNSTYLYKNDFEKLKMGPVWDYDNALDNIGEYLLDTKSINFQGQTWFSELVKDEEFCKKLRKRYTELSSGVLSSEYINNFIDGTIEFLGNARKRDWDRWKHKYTEKRFDLLKDQNGIIVDRNFETNEQYVQRVKDLLYEHSKSIPSELEKLQDDSIYKLDYNIYPGLAIIFILAFFISVIVIRRINN